MLNIIVFTGCKQYEYRTRVKLVVRNVPRGAEHRLLSPPPEFLIQEVWGEAWACTKFAEVTDATVLGHTLRTTVLTAPWGSFWELCILFLEI